MIKLTEINKKEWTIRVTTNHIDEEFLIEDLPNLIMDMDNIEEKLTNLLI